MGYLARALSALPLIAALFATPAAATQFATFDDAGGGPTLQWTPSGTGTGGTLATIGSTGAILNLNLATFADPSPNVAAVPVAFTFSSTAPSETSGMTGHSGSFSFIYSGASPLEIGGNVYNTGANLLSGAFTGGRLGWGSATTGLFQADEFIAGRTLDYTSDALDFTGLTSVRFFMPFTATAPIQFNDAPYAPDAFAANLGTTSPIAPFASAAVPEPATWAMMIAGFGLAGVALRRRRHLVTA